MKILFATDGSRALESALEHLSAWLGPAWVPGELAIVLVAVSAGSTAGPRVSRADSAAAIGSLARCKEILTRQGIVPKSIWRVDPDPAHAILDLALDERADVVVVGGRPRNSEESPIGRVSDQVLKRSVLPVLVFKPPAA